MTAVANDVAAGVGIGATRLLGGNGGQRSGSRWYRRAAAAISGANATPSPASFETIGSMLMAAFYPSP